MQAIRRPSAVWLVAWTLASVVVLPSLAHAGEPSAAARAALLVREGQRALARHDLARAEERFGSAEALASNPVSAVGRARALTGLGRLIEAAASYEAALHAGVGARAPRDQRQALSRAQSEIEAVQARFAWLTVAVSDPKDATVSIDDREMPAALVGVRNPVDPGEHTISVRAHGYYSRTQPVVLAEGEALRLDVALEQEAPAPAEARAPEVVAAPIVARSPPAMVDRGGSSHALGYVALAVGGAALVTGAATGAVFLEQRSSLQATCPHDRCAARYEDALDRYHRYGTLTAIAFGVGLAAAGAGVVLLLTGGQAPATADTSSAEWVPLVPFVQPDRAGVLGRF